VTDTMEGILTLARTEGAPLQVRLGHGHELLDAPLLARAHRGGGTASGPVSFMKGFDAFAA